MKILSNVTMAGNVSMSSTNKDTFTIGSELERDNPNADELKVWANANFYNDVIIGSSSADQFTIRAGTVNLSGTAFVNNSTTNLYVAKNGSDSNTGLTSGSALLTIQAAVDKLATLNATTNDREVFHVTINIASGSYEETVNVVNKGVGKSDSNLLVKFVGEREILHAAIPTTGAITVDPDVGIDNGVQCGVKLVFTGSQPAQDSLIGCFLISSDGYRTAVINSHSGSNFYINSVGFGSNDQNQTVNIVRPATEVKGFFRTAGINGAIAYDTIRIIAFDNGENCLGFGGFSGPPNNLEYWSNQKYVSVSRDEIFAYNCQIQNSGTVNFVFPPFMQFINGYIYGASGTLNLINFAQSDKLNFLGSFFKDAYLNFNGYKSLSFEYSNFKDTNGSLNNIISCIGPKKISYSSVNDYLVIGNVGISFLPNFVCKSAYIISYDSSITYYPDSYFIGPFGRIIDAYESNIDFYYGGNGPPSGSHYFSGSLEGDRLFILNQSSFLKGQGQLNLSNVYISGSYPLFYVNNSKIIYTHALPITASITSSNYVEYDVQLDDVAGYKYTDFPIVNQQGSLLDNRVVYYDIKTDTKIPFFAEDVTILDSITSNNGYKVNGNLVVGEAEYDLSGFAGAGAYESGSKFTDAFGSSAAEIVIGHYSSSNYGIDKDIIDIYNGYSGISVWSDGIDFFSPDGFISLQQIISTVNGGGGGGYADSAVFQESSSYEPYGGGTGSYFSGTVIMDASNSSQGRIEIGHISASGYQTDSDIIRAGVNNTRLTVYDGDIQFEYNNNSINLSQIYDSINGGGSAITNLQSTGSGESLVRDVNNGTGYLRSLKSTSTVNIIQQTNELEIAVNPNLTLTSLTSQGTLIVSGNVQLGDQSTDITTVTGQLTASNGIEVAGNIVPTASGSYSLGSSAKPFKEIFVGSGSISIASPYSGVVSTTISNNSGNLDISAGGVNLVGTGSFIGSGYGLYGILGPNIKHTYDFLTASGQSASAGSSVVYLNNGNNPSDYGLPDITGHDGLMIHIRNLKNQQATIRPYGSQKINDVVGTHNIAGNGYEAFHAVSQSSGVSWYTMFSSVALFFSLQDWWWWYNLLS